MDDTDQLSIDSLLYTPSVRRVTLTIVAQSPNTFPSWFSLVDVQSIKEYSKRWRREAILVSFRKLFFFLPQLNSISNITIGRAYKGFSSQLSLQSDYCLSPLYHSRNLLKKISEEECKLRLSVQLIGTPGKRDGFVVGGIPVYIHDIGHMFYGLLDEVKQRRTRLFSEIDLEEYIELPSIIYDEVNNTTPGFYFGDVKENNLKQYENLLHSLLDNPQWGEKYLILTKDKKITPKVVACREFLKEMESIRSIIGTLIFLCSGSPYRGTEFATTCIRNLPGGNIRNARFMSGDLTLISGYSKTSFSVWPIIFSLILFN